jgi:hypothetical protein
MDRRQVVIGSAKSDPSRHAVRVFRRVGEIVCERVPHDTRAAGTEYDYVGIPSSSISVLHLLMLDVESRSSGIFFSTNHDVYVFLEESIIR